MYELLHTRLYFFLNCPFNAIIPKKNLKKYCINLPRAETLLWKQGIAVDNMVIIIITKFP